MQELAFPTRVLALPETLQALEQKTGRKWSRDDFLSAVINLSLPLRSATPVTASPVMRAGDKWVHAALSSGLTRPMATMLTRHVNDLWVHGEAGTNLVALEEGQPGFLTWEQIRARRVELKREATSPEEWNANWPDSDWHDGEFMGESDIVFLSEMVTVTDQTVRVPAETINELVKAATSLPSVGKAEGKGITRRQVRRLTAHSIDALIETAIGLAGGTETGPVFLQLKEMALRGDAPFTGQINGESLVYTNDQNELTQMSKDLLRRRLKRRIG